MASEKWMADRQNRIMRQLRMEDKARENRNKAPLHTSDVMETMRHRKERQSCFLHYVRRGYFELQDKPRPKAWTAAIAPKRCA